MNKLLKIEFKILRFFLVCSFIVICSLQILLTCDKSWAHNIITIIPGSADFNAPGNELYKVSRFFDADYFLIPVNQTVTWFNSDGSNHQLKISHGSTVLAESKVIKPNDHFPTGSTGMDCIIFRRHNSSG